MTVKGICNASDFKRSEVLVNGLRVVRFDETTDDNGQMTFSEETVNNDVEGVKALIKRLIEEYDTSANVNSFTIAKDGSEIEYWLPAAKRGQLATGVAAVKANGGTTYTLDLREYGVSIDIPCETLEIMLSKLEDYAVKSYNATSKHLNAVGVLETIDDILEYDYKSGYPDKPKFEM